MNEYWHTGVLKCCCCCCCYGQSCFCSQCLNENLSNWRTELYKPSILPTKSRKTSTTQVIKSQTPTNWRNEMTKKENLNSTKQYPQQISSEFRPKIHTFMLYPKQSRERSHTHLTGRASGSDGDRASTFHTECIKN